MPRSASTPQTSFSRVIVEAESPELPRSAAKASPKSPVEMPFRYSHEKVFQALGAAQIARQDRRREADGAVPPVPRGWRTLTGPIPVWMKRSGRYPLRTGVRRNSRRQPRGSIVEAGPTYQQSSIHGAPETGGIIEFLIGQRVGEATDVLLIDESLCVRCDNCEKACAETHGGTSRLDGEAGPTYASIHVPTSCRHCEHPHCMSDCPADAIHRAPNGEVYIDEKCIGCGNCVRNCPYDVIHMASQPPAKPGLLTPWSTTSSRQVVETLLIKLSVRTSLISCFRSHLSLPIVLRRL